MCDDAHPDMNLEEGHLGGYIRSRHSRKKTVFGYEHGDPDTYYPALWRWAVNLLGVGSVVDVGCGEGHAARFFRDMGCRVLAVDGSLLAKRDSMVPDHHIIHDYSMGPFAPNEEFDLVWCCEFVEHVEERYLINYMATFSRGQLLMMTHADRGQSGHHHVNCQPCEYWVDTLAKFGFSLDRRLTRTARAIAGRGHFFDRGLLFYRDDS